MATLDDFYKSSTDIVSETAVAPISTTRDFGSGSDATVSGANLNFSGLTSSADCFVGGFKTYAYLSNTLTVGADDVKCFDPRDSTITGMYMYNTTTYEPVNSLLPYGEGREENYKWIDLSLNGRKYTNVDTITPVDNTTTIDITVPNHGFTTDMDNVSNASLIMSAGDYGTTGLLTGVSTFAMDSIIDANTIRLNTTLATWNSAVANGAGQNLYFDGAIMRNIGNFDWSAYTLTVSWKFNKNSPTFLESVYSDN